MDAQWWGSFVANSWCPEYRPCALTSALNSSSKCFHGCPPVKIRTSTHRTKQSRNFDAICSKQTGLTNDEQQVKFRAVTCQWDGYYSYVVPVGQKWLAWHDTDTAFQTRHINMSANGYCVSPDYCGMCSTGCTPSSAKHVIALTLPTDIDTAAEWQYGTLS